MLTDEELFEIETRLRARDAQDVIETIYDEMLKDSPSRESPDIDDPVLFKKVKKLFKTTFRLKPPAYYDEQINIFVEEGLKLYFGKGYNED